MNRPPDNATLALEARGLRKTFGATQALKGVDLEVACGEVVALVGENGAGKSTLVRIVSGEVAADEGAVGIAGRPLTEPSPGAAAALGVAVIHQELSFVGTMSVAENIFLSRLPTRGPLSLLDRSRLLGDAREALSRIAPHVDARRKMDELRVGDRQLVEVARAVTSGASLILMDEPTAALNADEVERLFAVVRALKEHDVGVLYISHRLDEIRQVADSVVVLRDGRRVAAHAVGDVSREQLVGEIVGKELRAFLREAPGEELEAEGEVRLELRDVAIPGVLEPVSLSVRARQILGLYGLAGSGVELVAQAVFGALPATGEVLVDGKALRKRSPARCRKAGLALVPADRRFDGLFPLLPVASNIRMTELGERGALAVVTRPQERAAARGWIEKLDVRPPNPDVPISALSGGNQQKSIVARWLVTRPSAFVLDEPTKGIDVGAKSQMYQLIYDLATEGVAVLVISPELPELMSLCSHIGIVTRGRLAGIFPTAAVDEQTVVDIAIGGHAA